MAFFTGTIYSNSLGMDTTLGVILPQEIRATHFDAAFAASVQSPKTLILLHGLSDNSAAWGLRSRILCYADKHGVAVLMPEVQRSFYQNMEYGEQYFTYISEELPSVASRLFHVNVDPQHLMVAGLSMGGYGALRCGLSAPDKYLAVGAFSSAIEMEQRTKRTDFPDKNYKRMLQGMFGPDLQVPEDADLFVLADRAAASGTRLPIMMTCGTEDGLYPENEAFFDRLTKAGMNVTFDKWTGVHEWGFWDTSISMFLDRFAN